MRLTRARIKAMQFSRKITTFEPDPSLTPHDLMTISEAAKALEMTQSGIVSMINRGRLTEIIDTNSAGRRYLRRFVLVDEIRDQQSTTDPQPSPAALPTPT